MFKSITFKLWVVLAGILLLSLGAFVVLTQISIHRQFLSFSFRSLQEQLPPLETTVVEIYRQHKSLTPFAENPSLWRETVSNSLRFATPAAPPRQDHKRKRFDGGHLQSLRKNQRQFIRSLVLYDKNRDIVAGQAKNPKKFVWHTVELDGKVIAYIGFLKPKKVLRRSEMYFMRQQLNSFYIVGAAMIIISLALALLFSKWLVKPLTQLGASARRVAQGDFDSRIDYYANDELGELCRNFNEMSARLKANDNTRKQWVANISHEMRTPLAVLKAQIEAVQDGIRPPTPENLKLLASKASELSRLIDDLFELALSDSDALRLDISEINFAALIQGYVEEVKPHVESEGFTIKFLDHTTQSQRVSADPRRLYQVFENLLQNSLRYSHAPGRLEWTLEESKHEFRLYVDDSTPAVPESELTNIFNRLYRLEKSRNRATGGAGLGLSLCQNLIRAHRGHIHAENSPIGGLRIVITLPKSDRH